MSKSIKGTPLWAVCAAFLLAAATPVSAGPLNVDLPRENALSSLVQQLSHFGPPPGKQCIKWTRRFNSRHGYGHRRCVHWK